MRKIFKYVGACILAIAIPVFAATAIHINQIKGGPNPGVFVLTSTNGVVSWGTPGTAPNFADAESPTGTVNGNNTVFTLTHTPLGLSLELYRNGIVQQVSQDYTLSNGTVTFSANSTPQTGDTLQAWYRY